MHSEAAWSALTPKPVLLYSKKVDNYIVYWAGIGMTRGMALSIAGVMFLRIWASPQIKLKLWEEFLQVYYANGFQTRQNKDWDSMIEGIKNEFNSGPHERYYSYIMHKVQQGLAKPRRDGDLMLIGSDSISEVIQVESPAEVLSWFKNDRAIIVE